MSALSGIDIALWDLKGAFKIIFTLVIGTDTARPHVGSPSLRAPRGSSSPESPSVRLDWRRQTE